jgi:hypothetical protein
MRGPKSARVKDERTAPDVYRPPSELTTKLNCMPLKLGAVTGVNPVTSVPSLPLVAQAGRRSLALRAAPATLRVGVATLGQPSRLTQI